jgi:hypothetical protein
VLKTVFKKCFFNGLNFNVPIIAGAPAGNAVLSWSWVSAVDKCKYYMNCADVKINGSTDGSVTGQRVVVNKMSGTPRIGEWWFGDDDNGHSIYVKNPLIIILEKAKKRKDGRVNDKF